MKAGDKVRLTRRFRHYDKGAKGTIVPTKWTSDTNALVDFGGVDGSTFVPLKYLKKEG